jgi:hypothetical protein
VTRRAGWSSLVLGATLLAGVSPLSAQPAAARDCALATPTLPAGHWAVGAARRAEALGLIRTRLPDREDLGVAAALRAIEEAAAAAAAPAQRARFDGWRRELLREFDEACGQRGGRRTAWGGWGGWAEAGVAVDYGRVAPGFGDHPPQRTGPAPLDDRAGAVLRARAGITLGQHVSLSAEPALDHGRVVLAGGELGVGGERWALSAGRAPVAYGRAAGGGIVLSGAMPLARVKLETARPLGMPWPVRFLGSYSFHTFVSRLVEQRHERSPYFWGTSGSWHAHDRFTVSVHRGIMFDPHGTEHAAVGLRTLWSMLIGDVKGYDFEDQIVSVGGRLRLPTEAVLPLTAYLEWGAEDAAGAWMNVPGQVFGLLAPTLPFAPGAGVGVEYARFGTSAGTRNPKWYRHAAFPGNWAWQDRVLGHGLGGAGRELVLFGEGDALQARLRWGGRAFARERHDENLFAIGAGGRDLGADRAGRSLGFAARLDWRLTEQLELRASTGAERGAGWAGGAAELSLRVAP